MILHTYKTSGDVVTVEVLDQLKELGFATAFQAGISIGIADMIIPSRRRRSIAESPASKIAEVEQQYNNGIITDGERYNKVIDIWTHASDANRQRDVFAKLEHNEGKHRAEPGLHHDGLRRPRQQAAGPAALRARGLMAKPSGEIIERPIPSNFREGLTVLEYFISTHGARKGLADTALKTADSGYLTRKLCRRRAGRHHHRGGLRHPRRRL